MNNSQTIQENNERIRAAAELLRNKAAGSIPISYGASLSLTIDSSTYVVTAQLKNQNDEPIGEAQTIDLPLESVVVSGRYDGSTKEVVLTLKDNSVIRFSIGDLIDGLVSSGQLANYYTKSEVDGKIPTKTSQLNNDSGFLTEHQSLEDYYTKNEVDAKLPKYTLDGTTLTITI